MNVRRFGAAMVAAGLLIAGGAADLASAQQGPPATRPMRGGPGGGGFGGGGPGGGGGGGGQTANLETNMKRMNAAYKTIGRQIDDASKDADTLKQLGDLESATALAQAQLPPNVERLEGEAKTKATAEYRKLMLQSLKDAIELQEAITSGDRAAAKAAYAKIDSTMKEGHKEFRPQQQR